MKPTCRKIAINNHINSYKTLIENNDSKRFIKKCPVITQKPTIYDKFASKTNVWAFCLAGRDDIVLTPWWFSVGTWHYQTTRFLTVYTDLS